MPVRAAAAGGETVFAGGEDGIFRSDDGGGTWQHLAFDVVRDGDVLSLAMPDGQTRAVFAGTSAGIFATTDGGSTWSASGLDGLSVEIVVSDAASPDVLYAASQPAGGGPGTLQRTLDGGSSWVAVYSSPYPITAVAVDPTDGRNLYAGTGDGRIVRSADRGLTWSASAATSGPVDSIAVDPNDPARVLATQAEAVSVGGLPPRASLLMSADAGRTFAPSGGLPPFDVNSLIVDPSTGFLYMEAGGFLRKSADGGSTWTGVAPGYSPLAAADLADGTTRIYGRGSDGLFQLDLASSGPCVAGALTLCVQQGRFAVSVDWKLSGETAARHAAVLSLTSDAGSFWFFSPDNPELVVKVLDGRATNGRFWVFYSSLSEVSYSIAVTDAATGATRVYDHPSGAMGGGVDTAAFSGNAPNANAMATRAAVAAARAKGSATEAADLELSGGRFRVRARWLPAAGEDWIDASSAALGGGHAGYFWFFGPTNVELLVKVLDGRAVNGHLWVFAAGLSGLSYRITVTDVETGQVQVYAHEPGDVGGIADTSTF